VFALLIIFKLKKPNGLALYPALDRKRVNCEMIKKTKPVRKHKPSHKGHSEPTTAQKQAQLMQLALKTIKRTGIVYGIWLVRQGLRARSEQFITIAVNRKDAVKFCKKVYTHKYCADNNKNALIYPGTKVNAGNDHLLIKGEDFSRQDQGRVNSNPLWFWVIAPTKIILEA